MDFLDLNINCNQVSKNPENNILFYYYQPTLTVSGVSILFLVDLISLQLLLPMNFLTKHLYFLLY